jgi:thioredoxin-related protein
MKKIAFLVLIVLMILPLVLFAKTAGKSSKDLVWLTDFNKAKSIAAAKKVPILIDFTGSDWCIWCKRLSGEVFEQKAFKDYAIKNLVLLKLDFPRAIPQTDQEKRANQALAQLYNIEGYPTIILTDAKGKEINRLGYEPGGPVKYVNHLKELISKPHQE